MNRLHSVTESDRDIPREELNSQSVAKDALHLGLEFPVRLPNDSLDPPHFQSHTGQTNDDWSKFLESVILEILLRNSYN